MATRAPSRATPEDLLKVSDRPMPELIDGEIVERPPMGEESDTVAAEIICLLLGFVREHDLGKVGGSQGSYQIFPDDPRKVRIPDVSFVRKERMPASGLAKGHSRTVPDLVVEVLSPNDTASDVRVKVREFLDAGVPLIWVVNPESRDVEIFRADGTGGLKGAGDILEGEGILPGFRVEVTSIFRAI